MNRRSFLSLATAMSMNPVSLLAQTARVHLIGMWTEGARKFYDPAFLTAQVGDVAQFINIEGSHNTESIEGMIPDGVEPWNTELEETFDLKLTTEGVYGYKCTPHYDKAMVGLIVVGNPEVNLEQARHVQHPAMAKQEFERLFEIIG